MRNENKDALIAVAAGFAAALVTLYAGFAVGFIFECTDTGGDACFPFLWGVIGFLAAPFVGVAVGALVGKSRSKGQR